MNETINIKLDHFDGRIFFFEEEIIRRCAVRMSQIMVYRRKFTLEEALDGGRRVMAATVLFPDLVEFTHHFTPNERTFEEMAFIEDIRMLDFAIAVDEQCRRDIPLLMHELSHVLYYYDVKFREELHSIWNSLDDAWIHKTILEQRGYEEVEVIDEFFAHLFSGFDDRDEILETDPRLKSLYERVLTKFSDLLASV